MQSDEDKKKGISESQSINLEQLLDERERLEELIKNRFTRRITVMFTDFKGSTSIAETEGDVFSRMLIKKHNSIVMPIIEKCSGVLVKTMGDGTLSYFMTASDAVRAAIRIQKDLEAFNSSGKSSIPILLRIGMNTGTGIVEKHDIFGDVVNVASRFESLAGAGEIYMSEYTFKELEGQEEFYCRHIRTASLKGKKEYFKVYKVFWNENEIEKDKELGDYTVPEPEESDPNYLARKSDPMAVGASDGTPVAGDSIVVQKARSLRGNNELVELALYCGEFVQLREIQEIYGQLQNDLSGVDKTETLFNGRPATWFFRDMITLGRIPECDIPISNQAFAKVPVHIGIRNGEGILRIESRGAGKALKADLQRGSKVEPLLPDRDYQIGTEGKIIFVSCFPFEYRVYRGRFLVVNMLNPEDCLQRQFKMRLADVWKDFESESSRFIIIGR